MNFLDWIENYDKIVETFGSTSYEFTNFKIIA
jgi:hypothetical protein